MGIQKSHATNLSRFGSLAKIFCLDALLANMYTTLFLNVLSFQLLGEKYIHLLKVETVFEKIQ